MPPLVLLVVLCCCYSVKATTGPPSRKILIRNQQEKCLKWRGGGTKTSTVATFNVYDHLARALLDRFDDQVDGTKLSKTLKSLFSAQKTLKGLDGAAYEAYQRTHHNVDEVDISVSGRARRSAARAGATANGLGACELCELVASPEKCDLESINGIMAGREVLLNMTSAVQMKDNLNLTVLVLFEPSYHGGAGVDHGGIEDEDLARPLSRANGRLLVILGDNLDNDLTKTLKTLDEPPLHVRLEAGLVSSEVASVQPTLYKAAGSLLHILEPTLRIHNTSAVHFVGHSLAGGIASLAATMLHGSLPMPREKKKPRKRKTAKVMMNNTLETNNKTASLHNETIPGLVGLAKDRTSAVTLGAPPTMSGNVLYPTFVTSILYGDDAISRTSHESMERLCGRAKKALKGGVIGRQVGWMSDTISLTVSGLKSHAHGSEGEEARLLVPGQCYLVRPRRLEGACSIHEVGGLKGGREALRAAVLWQLHDIILSKSLWKHHQLESYIQGLERVHLRGFGAEDGGEM